VKIPSLLSELYGRVPPLVAEAVDGLTPAQLAHRLGGHANSVGWLTWHLARVEDHHLAELRGVDQLWATGPWAARFQLEPDPRNTGYGHSDTDVEAVRPDSPEAIVDYIYAVHGRTEPFLATMTEATLDQIIDRRWDPPVTMGVRLVSVADDCLQHAGQAAYARGLLA
jgi:hypothetical protein